MPALPEIWNPSCQHRYLCFQLLSVKTAQQRDYGRNTSLGHGEEPVSIQRNFFQPEEIISIAGWVLACPEMLAGQRADCLHPYLDYIDHKFFGGSVLVMCLPLT